MLTRSDFAEFPESAVSRGSLLSLAIEIDNHSVQPVIIFIITDTVAVAGAVLHAADADVLEVTEIDACHCAIEDRRNVVASIAKRDGRLIVFLGNDGVIRLSAGQIVEAVVS